jgi:hypothetical protein
MSHFLEVLGQFQLQVDIFAHQLVDLLVQLLVFLVEFDQFGLAALPVELVLAQDVDLDQQFLKFALVAFDFLFQFRHFLAEIFTVEQRQHLIGEDRVVLQRSGDGFKGEVAGLQSAFLFEQFFLQLHDLPIPLLDLPIFLLDYLGHLDHLELQVCDHLLVELLVSVDFLGLKGFRLTQEVRFWAGSEVGVEGAG